MNHFLQKKHGIISMVCLFFCCISCTDKNNLTAPYRLYVDGYLNGAGFYIYKVSSTNAINDTLVPKPKNVVIKCFEDGQFLGNALALQSAFYQLKTNVKAGSLYRIEISADGYPTASSEVFTAQRKTNVKFSIDSLVQIKGDKLIINYNMKFDDPENVTNYYQMAFFPEYHGNFAEISIIYPTELVEHGQGAGVFFTDKYFNGKTAQITVRVEMNKEIAADVYMSKFINQTDKISYLYKTTCWEQVEQRKNGDWFGEPVQIYSNIVNGTGYFSNLY